MIKIDALEAALKRMKEHEPTWMSNDVVRAYRDSDDNWERIPAVKLILM